MLQFISTAYQVKVWRDLSLQQQHVARERFLWQLNLFGRHEKLTPWQGHAGWRDCKGCFFALTVVAICVECGSNSNNNKTALCNRVG